MSKIISIEFVGKQQTYDLEVDHHDHQYYLSNGILQSNSHAVAYAIDSYYAAWLHTYYEKEWLATILQSENGNPKGIAKAISEIKAYGYKIAPADINFSGIEWNFSDDLDAFVPPLTSLKGVGDKAVEEIFNFRPYKNLNELFYDEEGNWKHSKLNKSAFESLCKMESFSSLDEIKNGLIKNHKQLYHIIIDNYDILKKGKWGITNAAYRKLIKNGETPQLIIDKLIDENKDIDDWSRSDKINHYMNLSNDASTDLLFPQEFIDKLKLKQIKSVFEINGDETSIGWFCVLDVEKKSTKNGKSFMRLKVTDNESNTGWIRVWGNIESELNYTLWIAEVKNDSSWGMQANLNKMKLIDAYE